MSEAILPTIRFFESEKVGIKPTYLAYHPINGGCWGYDLIPIFNEEEQCFDAQQGSAEYFINPDAAGYYTTCGQRLDKVYLAVVC